MNTETPYENLSPELILDAIESIGFHCNGSLFPLNSYENRVYQIGIEDDAPLIAKFYRPQRWNDDAILEEHQFATELFSHEIPIVTPIAIADQQTLHKHENYRFAVFPRRGGRALELDNTEQLEWIGRFIGRLHAVGSCRPFKHRMNINAQTYGHNPYQFLIQNNFIPLEIKVDYCQIVDELLQIITQNFSQIYAGELIRLHGDCHAGNILWNAEGPNIVDLDDCLMGPAIQDIWMLVSGTTEMEIEIQLEYILRGYRQFYDFPSHQLKLIESLRTLRMIHYAAWLAKRWQDPTFPLNFPWFNTLSYWQSHLRDLHQQLQLLSTPMYNH